MSAQLGEKDREIEELQAALSGVEEKENNDEAMRHDLETLVRYKNDLELILEKSTSTLEQKNRKLQSMDLCLQSKDQQIEQVEAAYRKA